ncbi:hypothetical protein BREVNS_1424 [Brevinematales bacterium NS]|nr:hypothetical protein BREVNS_1424 [Brevinematales bacterium NS]
MLTQEMYEVLEEEFLEVLEKKDKESARHFLTLLLNQVEMKETAQQKENRIVLELQGIRSDLKTVVEVMNTRFEAMEKRFEVIDKRFEDMNKRFDDMNKRFTMMMWFIGILFSLSTAIIKWL